MVLTPARIFLSSNGLIRSEESKDEINNMDPEIIIFWLLSFGRKTGWEETPRGWYEVSMKLLYSLSRRREGVWFLWNLGSLKETVFFPFTWDVLKQSKAEPYKRASELGSFDLPLPWSSRDCTISARRAHFITLVCGWLLLGWFDLGIGCDSSHPLCWFATFWMYIFFWPTVSLRTLEIMYHLLQKCHGRRSGRGTENGREKGRESVTGNMKETGNETERGSVNVNVNVKGKKTRRDTAILRNPNLMMRWAEQWFSL